MRHVTRGEVSARYSIPESTISGWKKQLEGIIQAPKGARYSRPGGLACEYPGAGANGGGSSSGGSSGERVDCVEASAV